MVVYVTEQGSAIHKSSKRILIVKDQKPLQDIRVHELERLLLFGNVQLTTQAMTFLMSEGVDVSFLSTEGRYRGRLATADSKNIPLRLAQYAQYNSESFRLSVARRIVYSKIRNGKSLLMKYMRNHPEAGLDKEIQHLDAAVSKLDSQDNIQSLMGMEGESAAAYFRAYGGMFRRELQFTIRTRRPPRDPVNALLSLGYVLLTNEAEGILAAHGLDVHIGFFHEIEYGRPSLALDIVEEFRQPVVDRFVLSLANKSVFTLEDFQDRGEEGVYLQKESCKRYFALYDRMMTTTFKDRASNQDVTFRTLIRRQAERMMRCILSKEEYEPFLMD
jgi:CRISPR-associated protein Cas1